MRRKRDHVFLPDNLLADVDSLAGPRGRSAFLTEVIREAIHRGRLLQILSDPEPIWKDEDHRELAQRPEAWVRQLRDEDERQRQERFTTDWSAAPATNDHLSARYQRVDRRLAGKRCCGELLRQLVFDEKRLACRDIAVAEIYSGVRPHKTLRTDAFWGSLAWYDISREIARQAGRLRSDWTRQSVTLSLADTLLAARALEYSLTLMTHNEKHFRCQSSEATLCPEKPYERIARNRVAVVSRELRARIVQISCHKLLPDTQLAFHHLAQ